MHPEIEDCKNGGFRRGVLNNSSIVSVVKEVELALKLRIYSHKYYIISFLYDNPNSTSIDIQKNCPSSNSTFYKCLKELREAKIIFNVRSSIDMRNRRYHLSHEIKLFIEKIHKSIGQFVLNKIVFEINNRTGIVELVKSIESQIGFNYYSSELEILIFLYENELSAPSDMLDSVSTSEAAFFATLKRLVESQIISIHLSEKNGRKKLYRLSERTEFVLDNAHRILVSSELL